MTYTKKIKFLHSNFIIPFVTRLQFSFLIFKFSFPFNFFASIFFLLNFFFKFINLDFIQKKEN